MSSRGLPDVLMVKVDEYIDSLAPQIQPRVASELETFQQKTIDSLEDQVVDAFRSLFNKDKRGDQSGNSRSPWSLSEQVPDGYGGQSLPFADEIASLTRNFKNVADEANDDLRELFQLTEGSAGSGGSDTQSRGLEHTDSFSKGARGFLSAAIDAVQALDKHENKGSGDSGFKLDGLLGVFADTLKDTARNPEDKARLISPEIKERVSEKLREQHSSIAEQFTKIALDHLKRWLRGNTSSRDLGDGFKGEIEDQVKDLVKGFGGLFGGNKSRDEGSSRGFGDDENSRDRDGEEGESSRGFSKVISDKLSTGLAKVHREVRLEFRKILGAIEKQLFELLPDQFQRPLEKILGGNPFGSELDRDASPQADRGFGDDIKSKLVKKIRDLVRKVQETLRGSILGVVNGGHRKFERESWVFVQNIVEQKVQKYLPKVKISVPDDIGNEGVSVGAPAPGTQLGAGNRPDTQGGGHDPRPSGQQQHSQQGYGGQQDSRPSHHQQSQDYGRPEQQSYQEQRPDHNQRPTGDSSGYHNQGGNQNYNQEYQQNQSYGQSQGYGQGQSYGQNQGHDQNQGYGQSQGYNQNQSYEQNQGYNQNQNYGQNQGYNQNQGYGQNQGYQQHQGSQHGQEYNQHSGQNYNQYQGHSQGYYQN